MATRSSARSAAVIAALLGGIASPEIARAQPAPVPVPPAPPQYPQPAPAPYGAPPAPYGSSPYGAPPAPVGAPPYGPPVGAPPYGPPVGAPPYPYPYGYSVPPAQLAPPPSSPPTVIDHVPGQPVPPGYHEDTRMRWPMMELGGAIFLLAYLPTIYVASVGSAIDKSVSGRDDFAPLFIPIAGPFVTIASAHASSAPAFWLVLDGAAQATGVGIAFAGLVTPKHVVVRDDIAGARRAVRSASVPVRLSIAPTATADGSPAIRLLGRF